MIIKTEELNEAFEIFNNNEELFLEFIGALSGTNYEKDHQARTGVVSPDIDTIEKYSFKGLEQQDSPIPNFSSKSSGVMVSYCHMMKPWQQNVVKVLQSHDVYLVASPGAGKTLPIMCYYYNSILGLNTSLLPIDCKHNNKTYNNQSISHQNMRDMLKAIVNIFRIDIQYPTTLLNLLMKHKDNIDINRVVHSNNIIDDLNITNIDSHIKQTNTGFDRFVNKIREIENKNYPGQAVIALPRRSLLSNYQRDITSNFAQIIRGCLSFLSFYSSFGDLNPHGSTDKNKVNNFDNSWKLDIFLRLIGCLDSIIDNKQFLKNYFINRFSLLQRIKDNYADAQLNRSNSVNMIKDSISNLAKLDNSLNERLERRIESYIRDNLLYVKSGNQDEGNSKRALITICITESLNNLNLINDKANLKMFFIDEAHEMNYSMSVSSSGDSYGRNIKALDELTNKVNIIKRVFKAISEKNNGERIIFATGTINPESADMMVKYINKNYKRKMVLFDQGSVAKSFGENPDKNASNITIRTDNNLNNPAYLTKLLTSPRSTNNLIVLLSKKMIASICEAALKKVYPRNSSDINELKKQFEIPGFHKNIRTISDLALSDRIGANLVNKVKFEPKVEEISDPFLKQCVLCGFGYIVRNDKDPNDPRTAHDQMIVSELFSKGKIHTLLATTSVGIGVNIKVETMYIPDPTLPNSSTFEVKKNGLDELSQLLNRTGRADFKYSYIVTTDRSKSLIEKALSSTPDDFERRFVI